MINLKQILKSSLKKIGFSRTREQSSIEFAIGHEVKINYSPTTLTFHMMHCNLRCPNCLYRLKDKHPFSTDEFISIKKFKELLNLFPFIKHVTLTGGECLLHPQFDKIVEVCLERKLTVNASTNGILIKKWINSIKHLKNINVSLDGYDFESFKRYRSGTKEEFLSILEGIQNLKENKINFKISFVVSAENVLEASKMLDFAAIYQPKVLQFHSINPHGSSSYTPLISTDHRILNFLKEVMSRNDYDFSIKLPVVFDPQSPTFYKSPCLKLWKRFYVNENGDVALCCHLKHDPKVGNVFKGYDFNSPKMVQMRQMHVDGNLPKDCIFCHRRYKSYAIFKSKIKKWMIYGFAR